MPRSPKAKSNGSKADSIANLGFEATALRDSALTAGEAFLRSLRLAKDDRWRAADSRGAAETAGGNRSNPFIAA